MYYSSRFFAHPYFPLYSCKMLVMYLSHTHSLARSTTESFGTYTLQAKKAYGLALSRPPAGRKTRALCPWSTGTGTRRKRCVCTRDLRASHRAGADPAIDGVLDRARDARRRARVLSALVVHPVVEAVVEDEGGAFLRLDGEVEPREGRVAARAVAEVVEVDQGEVARLLRKSHRSNRSWCGSYFSPSW